jgi:hypothetical protein
MNVRRFIPGIDIRSSSRNVAAIVARMAAAIPRRYLSITRVAAHSPMATTNSTN